MKVRLTEQPANESWGGYALLSFDADVAMLHAIDSGARTDLRRIQQAGRRLAQMGIPAIELDGQWSKEAQWSIYQGYNSPKYQNAVSWTEECLDVDRQALDNQKAVAQWLRKVGNDTPEDLPPVALAQQAADFLKALAPEAISYEIIQGKDLLEQGLVGIYHVGKASSRPPALLKLTFCPPGQEDAPVAAALVGKGITFDSGGYSIKDNQGMFLMKADMLGAATVTAALALAITRGLSKKVSLFLCCAENLISGDALKLGDILKYKNGVSVEIANTDAEGRLVLADGLLLAGETGAPVIIDAATLTGAAMKAVGDEFNAVFALDEALRNRSLLAAKAENEGLWPLPLEEWHRYQVPSHYADTLSTRPIKGGGSGGASIAAGFLSRFVPRNGQGWLHFDLASAFNANDSSVYSAGSTTLGMRTIARLLLQETDILK